MRKTCLHIVSAVGLVCFAGCGKEEKSAVPSGTGTSGGPIAVFRVPEETVLVKVGNQMVTAGDFRRRLAYETGVFSFTMQKAQHPPKDVAKRVASFEMQRLPKVIPQLVHNALLANYLDASCGGRAAEGAEKEYEKAVRHLMPKVRRGEGLEGLAKGVGVTTDYLKEQLIIPVLEDKAQLVFEPASTNMTEKEIDEGLARMDAYTARAVASNAVIWVTASNVLAQVKAGADFAKLGETVGDSGGEASEWGFFEQDDIESTALRNWAFSAKDGEIGGPFEIEDGLSIVKLLSHKEGTAASSLASAQTAQVTLARINFPMVEENPEPRTRAHVREALLRWKARKAKERLFTKLFEETKIEYPNGDKLDFIK